MTDIFFFTCELTIWKKLWLSLGVPSMTFSQWSMSINRHCPIWVPPLLVISWMGMVQQQPWWQHMASFQSADLSWRICDMDTLTTFHSYQCPDTKVHGANMGPIWGRQDPGGPHVGPMNLDVWEDPATKANNALMVSLLLIRAATIHHISLYFGIQSSRYILRYKQIYQDMYHLCMIYSVILRLMLKKSQYIHFVILRICMKLFSSLEICTCQKLQMPKYIYVQSNII